MLKKIKLKHIHIGIIILGSLYLLLPVFHQLLWFDEAYSVGIATHTFKDIWVIGGHDVHPVLYYFILHLLWLIFKSNAIIAYRIFSWLCLAMLGIFGYTKVKKEFGELPGLIFSFLVYFLPVSGTYASEIRMYAFGMLLAAYMCIYAYKLYKKENTNRNLITFGIFSILLSYTHYYGLILAGVVNLSLFVHMLKYNKEMIKKFLIVAATQVILYIPWLIYFAIQVSTVSGGFWIRITFPKTLFEILSLEFYGGDIWSYNTYIVSAIIFSIVLYLYSIYLLYTKKDNKNIKIAISIYLAIILLSLLVSLCMGSAILYWRYLLIPSSLLIFYLSVNLSKGNKYLTVIILMLIFFMSSYKMEALINESYDEHNNDAYAYLVENYKEEDIILFSNISATAIEERMEGNVKAYYYSNEFWTFEAFKAFSPSMTIIEDLDMLKDYKGRIWIIESNTSDLMEKVKSEYKFKEKEVSDFYQKYKDLSYRIELLEK